MRPLKQDLILIPLVSLACAGTGLMVGYETAQIFRHLIAPHGEAYLRWMFSRLYSRHTEPWDTAPILLLEYGSVLISGMTGAACMRLLAAIPDYARTLPAGTACTPYRRAVHHRAMRFVAASRWHPLGVPLVGGLAALSHALVISPLARAIGVTEALGLSTLAVAGAVCFGWVISRTRPGSQGRHHPEHPSPSEEAPLSADPLSHGIQGLEHKPPGGRADAPQATRAAPAGRPWGHWMRRAVIVLPVAGLVGFLLVAPHILRSQRQHALDKQVYNAAVQGDVDSLVRALTAGGKPAGIKNKYGQPALFRAAHRGHLEALTILLDRGAGVDTRDDWGNTPLEGAVWHGRREIVRRLLQRGAAVNLQGRSGETALMGAAEKGHTDLARLLLNSGADPGIRNRDGLTASDLAQREGHRELARLLKTHPMRSPPPGRTSSPTRTMTR